MKRGVFGVLLMLWLAGNALADCQLTLSRPDLDYGKVRNKDYSGQLKRWKTLNDRQVQLTAVCDSPVRMAVFTHGGEQDDGFRFASDSVVLVAASNATLDGNPVMLGKTSSHAPFINSGSPGDKNMLRNNEGLLPVSGETILAGRQFSITLTVRPALSERDTEVKDKTTLESHLHFNVETE
ncbi:hypothetical protein [Atlantibacter subterraneus]|uniref:hypothetical protein n=1 Tax=Atlantibacter subterraneus TaxID=255519 RepID=UPI0028A23D85|nr:hypothetical protein [Atlantibacter subterranea]